MVFHLGTSSFGLRKRWCSQSCSWKSPKNSSNEGWKSCCSWERTSKLTNVQEFWLRQFDGPGQIESLWGFALLMLVWGISHMITYPVFVSCMDCLICSVSTKVVVERCQPINCPAVRAIFSTALNGRHGWRHYVVFVVFHDGLWGATLRDACGNAPWCLFKAR